MSETNEAPAKKKAEWRLFISKDVAEAVEELVYDDVLEKATYGMKSAIVEGLLRQWLAGETITPLNKEHTDDSSGSD